jgi:hypothetical protein
MSSAGRSASPSDPASERHRAGSPTAPMLLSHLSTIVDEWLRFVDNDVDSASGRAYCPTSAPLLRPVNG